MAGSPSSVLRCGVLVDGTGRSAREDVAVVMSSGRIATVMPWEGAATSGLTDYDDLRTCTVVPGMIDAHAHPFLGTASVPGWSDVSDDPVGIVAWGLASCGAALATGVTTLADVGSPDGLALTAARLLRVGCARGPKLLSAGPAITTTAGHGMEIGVVADSADEIVAAVRRNVARGADLIKIMVTGGAIDPVTNRRRAQYSFEELRSAVEDAHRLGRRVVGHANATEGIGRAVEAGIDIIAHCNWLGMDPATVVVDPRVADNLIHRGIWIDLNIQGALRNMLETDGKVVTWEYPGPTPTTRWELLQPLRVDGGRLYLTSDAFGPAVGTFTASLVQACGRFQLSAEEMVRLVTGLPAQGLGISDTRGTVEPGKCADLVVLSGDLREDAAALTQVQAVYQDGVRVVAEGRLLLPPVATEATAAASGQQALLDIVFEELV